MLILNTQLIIVEERTVGDRTTGQAITTHMLYSKGLTQGRLHTVDPASHSPATSHKLNIAQRACVRVGRTRNKRRKSVSLTSIIKFYTVQIYAGWCCLHQVSQQCVETRLYFRPNTDITRHKVHDGETVHYGT